MLSRATAQEQTHSGFHYKLKFPPKGLILSFRGWTQKCYVTAYISACNCIHCRSVERL